MARLSKARDQYDVPSDNSEVEAEAEAESDADTQTGKHHPLLLHQHCIASMAKCPTDPLGE
jgi:hypothetical protein